MAEVQREIPSSNSILQYLHCGRCLRKALTEQGGHYPEGQKVEVRFTEIGLQVVCKVCKGNIIHIDFQGQKHPANLSSPLLPGEKHPDDLKPVLQEDEDCSIPGCGILPEAP